MKIRSKLMVSFVIVSIIAIIGGVVGLYGNIKSEERLEDIGNKRLPSIKYLLVMKEAQTAIKASQMTILIEGINVDVINAELESIEKLLEKADSNVESFKQMKLSSEEEKLWNSFQAKWAAWYHDTERFSKYATQYLSDSSDKNYDRLKQHALGKMSTSYYNIDEVLDNLIEYETTLSATTVKQAKSGAQTVRYGTISGLVLGTVLALLFGVLLSRGIGRSLGEVTDKLIHSSQFISTTSNQLATSSRELSEGSTEQASSIEETSATIEESASSIKSNTENTKAANELSKSATDAASSGNDKIETMLESMNELKKSSSEISKIIKVIDEIAFQTNMLALNAAVEAARAGDAGQGFAVVAAEVRNLAQKSAQAAKDTAEIIEKNIVLSDKGVSISDEIKNSLNDIMEKTQKVNTIVGEILLASNEQAKGMEQISVSMTEMEKVVQNNVTNAEESATSAEELKIQTDELNNVVMMLNTLVKGKKAGKTDNNDDNGPEDNNEEVGDSETSIQQEYDISVKEHIVSPDEVIPLNEDDEF